MGKKHKKEHRRKRHRSHSSSESVDNEKEKKRHHKKKHKKEKKHCKKKRESSSSPASIDEVIELDTPSPPPPPSISEDAPKTPPPPSRKRERVASPKGWTTPPKARSPSPKIRAKSPGGTPPPAPSTSRDSLSIEETNALRIKLGMKPLQVDNKPAAPPPQTVLNGSSSETPDVILIEGEEGQFVHKPAENLTSKKESEKLRARLAERKEKRLIENKYKKLKTLAEDSDDESASAWVKKSRKIEEEKEKAAKRAQELDEMDKLFGVSELIDDEIRKEKKDAYTSKNLKGLTVEHDIEAFDEGKSITLTLKDKGVLDEEDGDTLVNVNLLDEERYKKNLLNKKQKPFGSLYDEEEDELEFAERSVLKKYDEEIGGEKKSRFTIGESRSVITKDKVKEKLRANMKLESLETKIEVASDYYTSSEMAKFKKPKKVRKIRKKPLKADDLLKMRIQELFPTNNDLGSRKPSKSEPSDELDVDDTPALPMDLEEVPFKVEVKEEETEFSMALKKARKLRQIKDKPLPSYLEVGERIKTEIKEEVMEEDEGANSIVLNSTAEFCRTLGDIPTYGLAGNREEADQLTEQLDFEKEMRRESLRREEEENQGGWQDAEMDSRVVDINNVEAEPILDAEPNLGSGVAGALSMAVSKGYLEKETVNRPNAARFTHLQAQNYSIEDKSHGEDEKFGNRRDRYMGPTSDFKEKDNYKPNINLEYIDDEGRILSAKEAFRYLSHKFHGKGPGKNKIEKRMKKNEQEVLMKQMSSSDTPLGTLQMLQSKQMETQSPFVVLSGSKHQLSAPTSISKSKFK